MSGESLALPRGRVLPLDGAAIVMGIVNATPDSFYGGSRVADSAAAVDRIADMVKAGAAVIDVGGESTRPGAEYVDADTEAALRHFAGTLLHGLIAQGHGLAASGAGQRWVDAVGVVIPPRED